MHEPVKHAVSRIPQEFRRGMRDTSIRRLSFLYSATLTDDNADWRFDGSIDHSWVPCESLKTPSDAAWSHVRGLLEITGEWRCKVMIGGVEETRTIDVDISDGMTFRMDQPIE